MTEFLHDFIRPRRMNSHHTMVVLDRGLKEAYRSGELVKPIKGRKRRPKTGRKYGKS